MISIDVHRKEQQILGEDVHILRPCRNASETAAAQCNVEVGLEQMDAQKAVIVQASGDEAQVAVDDLQSEHQR